MEEPKETKLIAVVRIRGLWGVKPKVRTTLEKLRLFKVNHCVIVRDSPQYRGMLNVCKDYVTYGPISQEVLRKMIAKRGRKTGNKKLSEEEVEEVLKCLMSGKKEIGVKPVFRLRPPKRGYKSIKKQYPRGAAGKRDSMDELILRMI